ncbi:hypothetical protein [Clostridium perfringens]|uniref:hypothetical protein n=1 Tax=Clostridium perfringens TaxID=1502 RepID=UPI0024BCB635|nr:hypothetical protein [Clostridium perfringens]
MCGSIALVYIFMNEIVRQALEEAEKLVLENGNSYKEMCKIINFKYKKLMKGIKNEKM